MAPGAVFAGSHRSQGAMPKSAGKVAKSVARTVTGAGQTRTSPSLHPAINMIVVSSWLYSWGFFPLAFPLVSHTVSQCLQHREDRSRSAAAAPGQSSSWAPAGSPLGTVGAHRNPPFLPGPVFPSHKTSLSARAWP